MIETRSKGIFALVSALMDKGEAHLLERKLPTRPDSVTDTLIIRAPKRYNEFLMSSHKFLLVDTMHTTGCLCGKARDRCLWQASRTRPDLLQKVHIKY